MAGICEFFKILDFYNKVIVWEIERAAPLYVHLGPLTGGPQCRMSNLRKGYVELSLFL